jgi:RimJ/RimL family protein N-acetyltransferase
MMLGARPSRIIEIVRLRDGSPVVIRAIEPDDRARILDVFKGLGEQSRYARFLAPVHELQRRDLDYLTAVDHHDHEAIVAIDPETGVARGVARFVRISSERDAAEVAVAVVDDWQERGLGTALMTRLTDRARSAGIRRYRAISAPENRRIRGILGRVGRTRNSGMQHGYVEYEVDLRAAA